MVRMGITWTRSVAPTIWCMAGTTSGSPRARVLGAWLRDAREAADLGVRELARLLDIGHTNISRWETAERLPRPEDVAMILTAVGVNGAERERLINLARAAGEPNWVTVGVPGASEALDALMEFEKTAKRVTEWSVSVIPGLLQTGDYTRAIMADSGASDQETDARVMLRLTRRDVLTRRNPVTFQALIGESALRQVIGGREVMADQLRHLLRMAEVPAVTLRVVPTGHGWHPGLAGPFELLEFETGRPIVHLEHLRSSLFLYEEEDDLRAYVNAAEMVRTVAMSRDATAGLIAEMITELEKME